MMASYSSVSVFFPKDSFVTSGWA